MVSGMLYSTPLLHIGEQYGVIYECSCDVCGELYVGEIGRSLGEKVEEHGRSIERQDLKVISASTRRIVRT